MSDDGGDGGVVHQQELELIDVVDDERVEAGAQHGSGGLVVAIADSGHQERVFVAAANLVIDTTGLSPRGLTKCTQKEETNENMFFTFQFILLITKRDNVNIMEVYE